MLIVTLGDPLSITIEGLLKNSQQLLDFNGMTVIVGHRPSWDFQLEAKNPFKIIKSVENIGEAGPGLNFLNVCENIKTADPRLLSQSERGEIATAALHALIGMQLNNKAIFTGPIDKFLCRQSGFKFPGQTEYFEDLAGSDGIMILAGPQLKVGLATNHLALSAVTPSMKQGLIERKINLLATTLQSLVPARESGLRIAVTGVNPHCGDHGLFGSEDAQIIEPAVNSQNQKIGFATITGPIPADTAFFKCYEGEYDAVLAMYHDQGLGPLKTVHFYDAVNITGGLPFLRVSPDHGPASNLYGKNSADTRSIAAALQKCIRYLS